MSDYSEMINKQFDDEVIQFYKDHIPACDHGSALKLLREFQCDSNDFGKNFWPNSVGKYLPAVAEGTMFLGEEVFEHTEANKIARQRVENVSYKDVVHAFIYGVSRGIPAYRTALPAFLHIKNIPEHSEDYLRPDDLHTSPYCDFCDYCAASVETKMSFMWINYMQYCRIYEGGYPWGQNLTTSSFLLREFIKMPKVIATKEDYQLFVDSLMLTEQLQSEKKIGAYKEILQKSKLLAFKSREYKAYLDILGYLDILHSDECRGVTKYFIRTKDMREPDEHRNDYGYPVRFWRAKNGVDWERVRELFDDVLK